MQSFNFPTMLDKVCGQPIQQFRVGGLGAFGSEIIRICCETCAEMMLPQSVDETSCCEAVFRVGDPLRECKSSPFHIVCNQVGINRI